MPSSSGRNCRPVRLPGRPGRPWTRWQVLASAACVLLALTAGRPAPAQEVAAGWSLRRWGPEHGLPVVGVNALARDEVGYLWLATFDGLVRFDGVRFERVDRPGNLPSPRLTTLWRGRHGGLWMTTEAFHLGRWERGAVDFVTAPRSREHEEVLHVLRHPDGSLLFALGSCLYGEEPDGLRGPWTCLEGRTLRTFTVTADGTLWLAAVEGGLHRKRPGRPLDRVQAVPAHRRVTALADGGDRGLWVGTSRGLLRLAGGRAEPVPLGPDPAVNVLRIEPAPGGGAWVATSRGLYQVGDATPFPRVSGPGLTGAEPIQLTHRGEHWLNHGRVLLRDGVEVLRTESVIKDVLGDPEGNLWVATSEEGLLRLRPSAVTALGPAEGLPPRPVYPVVEGPDGVVWVGLHGAGLARVRDGVVELVGGSEVGASRFVWSILPQGPDEALVGGRGLWRYRAGKLERTGPPELGATTVRALLHDSRGQVWLGTQLLGIFLRRPEGAWRHLGLPPDRSRTAAVQGFLESRTGAVWIATAGGGLLRRRDGRFESLNREDGFPSDSVRALWEDGAGDLWAGTEDAGLVRVRLPEGAPLDAAELAVVDRRHGLLADGVHRILPDENGRLWMSSNRGIFRVEEAELRAVAEGRSERLHAVGYTEADGLPAREANGGVQSAGMRSQDGRLWFPTVAGVAVVDPDRLRDNPVPPPVVVEAVRPPGGGEALAPAAAGAPLRLGPALRTFEVEYTALSFADPERVRFRVLLEGLTGDWLDVGARRRMLFTDVPPGRYRLRVVAANEHGVWSPEGAVLPLVVVPRWWETGAARAGGVGLFLALAAGGVVHRIRHHRRRERELEALVDARTVDLADALQQATQRAEALQEADAAKSRFFAHVSHELRTPLTLLVGPLLDAREDPERLLAEAPVMRRAAQSLSRMVEQILDLEKAEAGRLEVAPEPRDLARITGRVAQAFSGLARRWGIALACEAQPADPVDPEGPVAAVDLEQMERALANLVSNALRFTPQGGRVTLRALEVETREGGTEAVLEVADTGRGIPGEALPRIFDRFYQVGFEGYEPGRTRGTGIGLALVRELVELHGGRVEVESEVGRGSTFRIRLPICREEPRPIAEAPDSGEPSPWPALDREGGVEVAEPDEPDDSRQTILVVEDHPEIRRSVCRLLGSDAFRTVPAPEGATGLCLARRLLPDLVVADVSMPEMDGFEMARRLAADPETAGIPVLFLTARAAAKDQLEGFAAGAVAYVRKPFAGDVLRARVASLLRRQRRLAERLRQAAGGAAPDPARTPAPPDLADRARRAILQRLDDETFGPVELGRALAMGRSQLFERFRDELGTTPAELLRAVRLERARELLRGGAGSVSEVAYAVGFSSLAGFSRAYRARYGEPPSATLGKT